MGNVIPRSSGPERIFDHFNEALDNARLAGGEIKTVVEKRLGALEAGVGSASDDLAADKTSFDEADKILLTTDVGSDLVIPAVLDEIWNALGRPQTSIEYSLIAGTGKEQWTEGDPREQPIRMKILSSRIRATTAFGLQAGKEGWAQRIDEKTAIQEPAATAVKNAEAKLAVSQGIARAVANLAQVALARLKRDLQNIGLTETQIHDIIPNYEAKPRNPGAGKGGGGGKGEGGGKTEGAKPGEAKPVVPVTPVVPTPVTPVVPTPVTPTGDGKPTP